MVHACTFIVIAYLSLTMLQLGVMSFSAMLGTTIREYLKTENSAPQP